MVQGAICKMLSLAGHQPRMLVFDSLANSKQFVFYTIHTFKDFLGLIISVFVETLCVGSCGVTISPVYLTSQLLLPTALLFWAEKGLLPLQDSKIITTHCLRFLYHEACTTFSFFFKVSCL